MRVLIAGSHGKIGRRLTRLLADRGHEPVAMIRSQDQAQEMTDLGGTPLVADLAGDVDDSARGVDAIVFTAGGGPGSSPESKQTIDRGGAEKLVASAERHGVRRYVIVSSMGSGDVEAASEMMKPYQEAKGQADEAVAASDLDWTIVRPGGLTDDDGDGLVDLAVSLGRGGQVPRDDVAVVIADALEDARTFRRTFEVLDGDRRPADAFADL